MEPEASNWQTPAALLIVALTVALFCWRYWRNRRSRAKGSGCGAGCCPTPLNTQRKDPPLN